MHGQQVERIMMGDKFEAQELAQTKRLFGVPGQPWRKLLPLQKL